MVHEQEKCGNPWKADCARTDIEVYISKKSSQFPICANCWSNIACSDFEWRV